MLSDRETPHRDLMGVLIEDDPRCQWCERSVVARFGGEPGADCASCSDDWKREMEASGGMIEEA